MLPGPADRVLYIGCVDAQLREFGAHGIGALHPHRPENNATIFRRHVVILGFANCLNDGFREG